MYNEALLNAVASNWARSFIPDSTPQTAETKDKVRVEISTEADLRDYLWSTWGIRIPDKQVCAAHVSPWHVFKTCYFAEHSMVVLKASRGLGGKSHLLAALATAEGSILKADVTVLGGSGGQSQRVLEAMDQFWRAPNAPVDQLRQDVGGKTRKVFQTGNKVEALTASQRSVRSPHPQRLRLDEIDEMDLGVFDAAMGQTLAKRGIRAQTLAASTHQYDDGTFSTIAKRAAEKGWPLFEYCYRETLQPHGWLAADEVARKRGEMTDDMWNTEVELQEPSSEGRAINQDAVEAMFDKALGESEGKPGDDEEWERPDVGGAYATGGDWGKFRDYSCIPTLRHDGTPARFVAFYRMRRTAYHVMVPVFNRRVGRYPGTACHDAHGVGTVVDEMMEHETEGYVQWAGAPRRTLFTEYIAAIERGAVKAPRSTPWYRAHKYVTNDDLYGDGHPPDEFVSCALAWRAAKRGKAKHGLLFAGDVDPEETRTELERIKADLGIG